MGLSILCRAVKYFLSTLREAFLWTWLCVRGITMLRQERLFKQQLLRSWMQKNKQPQNNYLLQQAVTLIIGAVLVIFQAKP